MQRRRVGVASGGAGALHRVGAVVGRDRTGTTGGSSWGKRGFPGWKLVSEQRAGCAGHRLMAPRSIGSGATAGWVTDGGKKLIMEGRMGKNGRRYTARKLGKQATHW
ncbi:hypothetical protein FB451DRAFT_1164594 [Mycena latifolia]|nr:hypothetical protein FB451DRAFT_1164594 [Mycena latifolia]